MISLRPLTRVDIPSVLAIEAELFGAEAWTRGMFVSELDAGHYYRAAIEDSPDSPGDHPAGPLVGYAGLAIVDEYEAWVQNIAVRAASQGRGVGTRLLEDLLAQAGERSVGLEVATDNPAQRLYARYGFEVVAVRKRYYQPSGTDALVMLRKGSR